MAEFNFNICQKTACKLNFNLFDEDFSPLNFSNITAASLNFINIEDEDIEFDISIPLSDPVVEDDFKNINLSIEDGSIIDGIYDVTLSITLDNSGEEETYTTQIKKFFYYNTQCCVYKMASKTIERDCKKQTLDNFITASNLLTGLRMMAADGKENNYLKLLEKIDSICKMEKCNCKNC